LKELSPPELQDAQAQVALGFRKSAFPGTDRKFKAWANSFLLAKNKGKYLGKLIYESDAENIDGLHLSGLA
jgi:hypothetical protein